MADLAVNSAGAALEGPSGKGGPLVEVCWGSPSPSSSPSSPSSSSAGHLAVSSRPLLFKVTPGQAGVHSLRAWLANDGLASSSGTVDFNLLGGGLVGARLPLGCGPESPSSPSSRSSSSTAREEVDRFRFSGTPVSLFSLFALNFTCLFVCLFVCLP